MSARDNDPKLHRIEVVRDAHNDVLSVRFVCLGGDAAPCHHFPACDCEGWGEDHYVEPYDSGDPHTKRTPRPGHEDVQQDSCWIDPWFNACLSSVGDWLEAWDSFDDKSEDDLKGGSWPVSVSFEGDYMTWEYAS